MGDWGGYEILNQRCEQIEHLFAAVLQLRRLPYNINIVVRNFTLHGEKIQYDMALLDNLQWDVNFHDVPTNFTDNFY